MSRGAQTFKRSDVTKAVKGAVDAGLSVCRIEIDKNGKDHCVRRAAGNGRRTAG
jgi:hypothetical protein